MGALRSRRNNASQPIMLTENQGLMLARGGTGD